MSDLKKKNQPVEKKLAGTGTPPPPPPPSVLEIRVFTTVSCLRLPLPKL